ncbi:hypothetical protein C8Q75DRAFT_82775 [Abortiporus biennis]|nr:hypothetical protein C8Q75DRAFT_82775 [Abortiporus biennis]
MWSKLSNALKRPSTPGLSDFDDESHAPQVLAGVYEQHPNMSVFHQQQQEPQSSEVPFPSPSPPPSPSRSFGRRGLLKRMSKMPFNDSEVIASSPKTIGLPKKVKSSLQSISTGMQSPLSGCYDAHLAELF